MKRSRFLRIFSGFFLATFAIAAYILLFTFRTIENYFLKTTRLEFLNLGCSLLPSVQPRLTEGDYAELDRLVKAVGADTERRINVISPDGTARADSTREPNLMENHRGRPEVQPVLAGETGINLRFSGTVREEMLYAAIPVTGERGSRVCSG